MCVIIIKRKGIALPNDEFLKQAYNVNHDGCGFVSSNGEYHRFLSFDSFLKSFHKCVTKDDACIIHFRWATHGSIRIANCHPFYKDGIYFAHNGVLPMYETANDKTDSQTCFENFLLPLIKRKGFCSEIDRIRSYGKFAFMKDGEIKTYGNYIEYDGLLLSNTRFLMNTFDYYTKVS